MSEETKYKVINPYHFVPLAKKCNRGAKSGELITGKMKIAITTKTPLFIPNITSERKTDCDVKGGEEPKKEHSQYEFFSYHQYKSEQSEITEPYEPIIPGSEIRGMVRGIYEAVTGSCLSAIELDKPSLESILKREGFEPCKSSENMCPACQLFGMVGDNSVASKLRFSDARLDFSGNIYDYMYNHFVVLEELSQPKISATEMYLQRPVGAEFWTYDYYVKNKKIEEYTASNPVQIMGRKFYWHHQFEEKKPSKTIRNKSVRLLKEGITFTENIYFENITREQLGQLYFLLNISKKEDESGHLHCYKLGSGKPLGLGSVSVQVIDVIERKLDLQSELIFREEPYKIEEKSYEDNGFDRSVKKAFDWATDFNIVGKQKVSYPLTEKQYESCYLTEDGVTKPIEQGFEWFTENKGGKLKQRNSISVKENLKSINAAKSIEDIALSCWKKENKEQKNRKQSRRNSYKKGKAR